MCIARPSFEIVSQEPSVLFSGTMSQCLHPSLCFTVAMNEISSSARAVLQLFEHVCSCLCLGQGHRVGNVQRCRRLCAMLQPCLDVAKLNPGLD